MSLPTHLEIPLWRRIALAACMFLTTSAMGFLQPFVPLYLEAAGIARGQVGLVAGLGSGLALLTQPLLGHLSDRLDARRPLMCAAALAAGAAYLSFRSAHGLPTFVLLTALGVTGTLYLNTVGGVLVGQMVVARTGGGRAYAGYRVWGSVGYILVAMGAGWLVGRGLPHHTAPGRADLAGIFTYGPLLFFAIALVALLVPDRKRAPILAAIPAEAPLSGEDRDRDPLPENLRRFLVAYFLYQFSLYGATAYISLFLKSLGATPLWITSTFVVGVLAEVLMMTQVGRWTDVYGRRPALATAFILMPLRLLLYIPARGPLWVLLVQSLHGFNFGIMGTVAIVFVNDLATDRNRGAAQARLTAVGGLATALGPATCGWLVQSHGFGGMFATMSAVGAAGAAAFLARVQESHPAPLPIRNRS